MILEIALKSVGLLGFVALVAFALRRASAALRHRVWVLGFVGLAALPLLALRLPSLDVEGPSVRQNPPSTASFLAPARPPKASSANALVRKRPAVVEAAAEPRTEQAPAASASPSPEEPSPWPWLLLAVYVVVAALLLGRTACQLLVAAAWARRGDDVPSVGVPPHTRVARTAEVEVPMTLGFLRPTILLPAESTTWSEARLRAVLLHEGAHIRRGDWAWLVFARVVACVYWPNPLVHAASARMRAEGEFAADDMALGAGIAPTEYATTLVDLAEGLRGRSLSAALPFVERNSLKARVAAVLSGARRRPLGRRGALAALLLGAAVVLPFAAARLVAGPLHAHKGRIDMGPDGVIEVAAITSMDDGEAVSWDANGARLPQPYFVEKAAQDWMDNRPAPAGSVVRYVFLRAKLPGAAFLPDFTDRPGGEPLTNTGYGYDRLPDLSFNINDPRGAQLRIVRVVAPQGQAKGRMYARVPVGVPTPYLKADFLKGVKANDTRPEAGLTLRPALPGQSWKSQIDVVLPPEFGDREVRLVATAPSTGQNVHLWEGMSGPQTSFLESPAESVRRVEVFTRPTQAIVLDDLPLFPRNGASTGPRARLPEGTIEARNGTARLPDGSWLTLEGVWDGANPKGNGWNRDGTPLALKKPAFWIVGEKPIRVPGLRARYFSVFRRSLGDGSQAWVFDGDGLDAPLQDPAGWTFVDGPHREEHIRFAALAGPGRRTMSLLFKTAPTPYRTVAEGTLGLTPGFRAFSRKGSEGPRTFAIEFPREWLARMRDVDVSLVPLDAAGKEVRNASKGIGSSRNITGEGENVIEYNLTPDRWPLVRRLALRTRPFVWIRFPDVRLDPR